MMRPVNPFGNLPQDMQPFHGVPAAAVKTYQLLAPLHLHGWATTVAAGSDDEALIRRAGRHFTVEPVEGGFLRFLFPPGQACFKATMHRLPLEREPLYVVRGGDWRGNPTGYRRQHANGQDWVEDFGEHQQHIADKIERG